MLILILPPLSPCPNSLLSRTYLYTPNKMALVKILWLITDYILASLLRSDGIGGVAEKIIGTSVENLYCLSDRRERV